MARARRGTITAADLSARSAVEVDEFATGRVCRERGCSRRTTTTSTSTAGPRRASACSIAFGQWDGLAALVQLRPRGACLPGAGRPRADRRAERAPDRLIRATAYFIDVWYFDCADTITGPRPGRIRGAHVTQRVWGEAFAWVRDHLGGDAPQISEAGHDQTCRMARRRDAQQLRIDPKGPSFTWRFRAPTPNEFPGSTPPGTTSSSCTAPDTRAATPRAWIRSDIEIYSDDCMSNREASRRAR